MANEEKKIYRVLRPLQHHKTLFTAGDGIELTDDEAGHLLTTSAIEPPATQGKLIVKRALNPESETDLSKMTVKDLLAYAASTHDLTLAANTKKPDIIAAIEDAKAATPTPEEAQANA